MDNLNNAQEIFEGKENIELLKQEIQSKNEQIRSLEERIEEDRNAIMQIRFEANQHKQEELD